MKTNIAIFVICFVLLGTILYVYSVERRYRKFQNNIKPGIFCRYYILENADTGIIESIEEDTVTVKDAFGILHKTYKSDIYPV